MIGVFSNHSDWLTVLNERFGLSNFRPMQEEIIRSIIDGCDTLAVMATGGGKSLCYQFPGLVLEGSCIVVSPLIALMQDQVYRLNRLNIPAVFISSMLSIDERKQRLDATGKGQYKFIFAAPERLSTREFREALSSLTISFLAIDEAHCVSMWGHDFRPHYLEIGAFAREMNISPLLALTGTATPAVKADIIKSLSLHDPHQFQTTFDRPNLKYAAYTFKKELDKLEALQQMLRKLSGSGAVYASTRNAVEMIGGYLQRWGFDPVIYHAALTAEQRKRAQHQWVTGEKELVVATNAFGMGIDKSDVRYVIHYHMPGNMENYYQEAGRAGRDGKASFCIALHSPEDREIQTYFIDHSYPPIEKLQERLAAIRRGEHTEPDESRETELLLYFGFAVIDQDQLKDTRQSMDAFSDVFAEYIHYREQLLSRQRAAEEYFLSGYCRRKGILKYFEEEYLHPACAGCDDCLNVPWNEISTVILPNENDQLLGRQLQTFWVDRRQKREFTSFLSKKLLRQVLTELKRLNFFSILFPGQLIIGKKAVSLPNPDWLIRITTLRAERAGRPITFDERLQYDDIYPEPELYRMQLQRLRALHIADESICKLLKLSPEDVKRDDENLSEPVSDI